MVHVIVGGIAGSYSFNVSTLGHFVRKHRAGQASSNVDLRFDAALDSTTRQKNDSRTRFPRLISLFTSAFSRRRLTVVVRAHTRMNNSPNRCPCYHIRATFDVHRIRPFPSPVIVAARSRDSIYLHYHDKRKANVRYNAFLKKTARCSAIDRDTILRKAVEK